MNDRDKRREKRLVNVKTFGEENAADFDPASVAMSAFAKIADILLRLDAAKVEQAPARASKAELRERLAGLYRNVADSALTLESMAGPPGFAADYKMPATLTDGTLLTHGDKLVGLLLPKPLDSEAVQQAKAAIRARFVSLELSASFAETLLADVTALRGLNKHNQAETQEGVENTALIGGLLAEGAVFVDRLSVIMRNKYAIPQPAKYHAWERTSRIESPPRRRKGDQEPEDDKPDTPPSSGPSTPPSPPKPPGPTT